MIRVAINGYGRIGRVAHRIILNKYPLDIEVVAINVGSSTDLEGWMYLLKYDSVYGQLSSDINLSFTNASVDSSNIQQPKDTHELLGTLNINGKDISVYSQRDISQLPWKNLNVDVVIEATGSLLKKEQIAQNVVAGAKKVVLSAPTNDEISTYIISVNNQDYKNENIISNASCTTNCIAPVTKVLMDAFGVEKGMMTTVHAYTSDQRLLDGGHKDYRRARSAGINIVPTSTGATKAVTKAFSVLEGKFTGLSIRVPVSTGSLSDCTYILGKSVTVSEVNKLFEDASRTPNYKGILGVTRDPLVSSDIIGNSHSAIIDLSLTQVVDGNMLKVISWYDNEFAYANRLVEQLLLLGEEKK